MDDGGLQFWQQYQQEEAEMVWKDTGGTDFAQPPVGTHAARCVRIIDIGTQQSEYQGRVNHKRQVVICWELPDELIPDGDFAGQPFMVSRFYTASLSEKANLRKDLVAWRGREFTDQELAGFDPRKVLGAGCMLSLITNDKGKTRVGAVMALPKNTILPKQVNESIYFSLEPGEYDGSVFAKLSDGYKRMIQLSPEYQEIVNPSKQQAGTVDEMEDDIPF